ncbi:MAG: DUF2637 domain-containing protein [Pseudonocardia sp.]
MSTRTTERDLWAVAGMTIAATSAAVASFSGLRGLAVAAGWPAHLAWLLPVTVDAYAMTSTRLWLAGRTRHRRARRFAAANALGAIAGSVAGNAVYHAVSTGLLPVSWPIVVSVGAVPAVVLGLTAHLHALHGRPEPTDAAEPEARSGPEPGREPGMRTAPGSGTQAGLSSTDENGPESGTGDRPGTGPGPRRRPRRPARKRPRYPNEAELIDAARVADQRYRDEHGRPITRDALRAALRISGPRATELRRRLAGDPAAEVSRVPVPDAKEVATQR